MKIGIVTQPLKNNYGGLLQNFALQKVLNGMNYEAITIDFFPPKKSLIKRFYCVMKKILLKKENRESLQRRKSIFDDFVDSAIKKTPVVHHYTDIKCLESYDAFIVGSDQVWRPGLNYRIEDMYLRFLKGKKVKRMAYAASFGVETWEYSPKQTRKCCKLAKKFDAISVREESGVKLCREHLGVDATWVLDPTLLLEEKDYMLICKKIPPCKERYLAVYVLDENEEVTSIYKKEAESRGLVIRKFHADSKSNLTVPEWVAMFRDASYVVTDSFHGTVFSIIFKKKFRCIYNKGRGATRFDSLLNLYNSGKLEMMRAFSLNWLKNVLEA